jgi:hypothetical protein
LVSVEYISIRSGVSISLSYRRKDTSIWVTWNEDNVSEWGDMTIRELLFQWVCTMTNQHNVLVYYKADLIIILLEINLFLPWYSWKMSKQQWLTHSYIISQGGNGSFISSILLIIVSIRFIFLSSEGARLINMTRSVEFEVSCPCSRFFCFLHIYCGFRYCGHIYTWTLFLDCKCKTSKDTLWVPPPVLSGVRVTRSLVLYVCFVNRFVLFLLAIMLSVLLRFTDSDHPFGIFIPFLLSYFCT